MNDPRLVRDAGGLGVLQSRIATAARTRDQPVRRVQVTVAQVVVAQLLPAGAVKGGAGLKLRFGDSFTRDSSDLDTAIGSGMEQFVNDLSARLAGGWGDFTGEVLPMDPPSPQGVPDAYVMRPFAVKLKYRKKSFTTLQLEVGYGELEALGGGLVEEHLAADVAELFAELGLSTPGPVRLLPVPLQIAQKLHACSAPGSERAHDLVDLQLLEPDADDAAVAEATRRLFDFRRAHTYPPAVAIGAGWGPLYDAAAEGLDVLPDVADAVTWTNDYIARLYRTRG